jgi:acetyl-CoA carboxylase biotin carboxylase subunit
MFHKLLVANRGEVAVRIIRACHELGIKTVAVYSEADRGSLPVLLSDKAVCIGPAPALNSYLNAAMLLEAARQTGCDALHPGYGFLSENADFAQATGEWHVKFIGPPHEAMRKLGDKLAARALARQAGVPVIPGSEGEVRDVREAARVCAEVGFPVMVKAAAGGGGKGMRMIRQERDLETGMRLCQAEAHSAFGDGRVYIEKMVGSARHVEIQVLADEHGNVVHLGERDCSAQRRHQKFLEECPSPVVDESLRHRLGGWAIALCRAAGYASAGTVEFLVDEQRNCFFLEVNCRLQVEHPITEMTTGVDIVREQILVAGGERLTETDSYDRLRGHAIECRICAEDPDADFEPKPGRVADLRLPAGIGIRVDSYLMPGCAIPPFYDSLIAKVIAWAPNRNEAIPRMRRALAEMKVGGITTTIPFLLQFLQSERFQQGKVLLDTA